MMTFSRKHFGISSYIVTTFFLGPIAQATPVKESPVFHFFTVDGSSEIATEVRYPTDVTVIKIDGLIPATRYTLTTTLAYGQSILQSQVDFSSDVAGAIDTASAQPLSGSYTHVDPDGIFWSMKVIGSAPASAYQYRFELGQAGVPVKSAVLPLSHLRPGVRAIPLHGDGLVGTLYLPASPGTHPAVIAFGGSEGGTGLGETNAAILANAGYVGLGLGYFGASGLPPKLENIPLEYFKKAIQFLQSQPEVQKEKIAVMGMSRGGELALLLGATYPEIKAIVGQVPSPVRWGGNVYESGKWPPAWTFNGIALPFLSPTVWPTSVTLPDGRTAYNNRPVFEAGLKDTDGVAASMSEIEKTNGPIFMIGGEDDQVWPSCDLIDLAMKRLRSFHHPFSDQAVCYPKAGHSVGLTPGGDTTSTVFDEGGYLMNLGGDPEAIAFGQRDSWTKMLRFLAEALR